MKTLVVKHLSALKLDFRIFSTLLSCRMSSESRTTPAVIFFAEVRDLLTVLSTSRTLPLDPAALPNIQFYHALRMINKLSPSSWISQLDCVDISCYLHIQFDKRPDNCGQYLVSPLIQNSTHQIAMSRKGQANYICRMQSIFCSRAINDFIKNITKVSEVKVSLKHSLNFIEKIGILLA